MNQNRFTLSRLALCVGLAIAPAAALASPQTDAKLQKVSSEQQQTLSQYVVVLNSKGAWQAGGNEAQAQAAQDRLVAHARTLDGNLQVVASSMKLTNSMHLRLSAEAAKALESHEDVAGIYAYQPRFESKQSQQLMARSDALETAARAISAAAPALTAEENAGAGIKVAILSTGIDYTHKDMGGDGTEESYANAMANATTEFDGFPTDVVVSGHDFASEAGWGEDLNPIDGAEPYEHWSGWVFPTGRGTALASVVRTLAPGAQLMAYKMAGVADPYGYGMQMSMPSVTSMAAAMEHAVEAGADIIMVDHNLYGYHFAAYNDPSDGQASPLSLDIDMVNAASAKGALVVTTAGMFGEYPSKYNVAWMAAANDSLAVGGVESAGEDQLTTSAWSPHGPVRGTQTIKPDLVSYATDIDVATPGSGDGRDVLSHPDLSVARVAAAAAILKSQRPELSNLEVKALLTNTANHNVQRGDSGQNASVTHIGGGVENMDAALTSPVAIWEKDSHQPHLKFGHQEVDGEARLVKEVSLRNYSDKAQTYTLSIELAEGREGNSAISWTFPESVTVPANSTLTVPVIMEINGAALPAFALTKTGDYGIENWEKMELNGYLMLSADEQPTLNMGWSVLPRSKGSIRRNFDTFEEYFGGDHPLPWSEGTEGRKQSFTNTGDHAMTVAALPIMASRKARPEGKQDTNNLFKHVGGGVFDAAQCSSGKKMMLGATMQAPMDIAVSNHMDKIGDALFYFEIYPKSIVEMYELDKGVNYPPYLMDEEWIGYGWVTLDENGQPITTIIDLNQPYDYANPTARYTTSVLPAYFTPGSSNVVAQFCLEEMFHHEVDSVEDFDSNLGFIFSTDRDAFPDFGGPIVQYNPVKYGTEVVTTYFDWFSGQEMEQVSYGTAEIKMNRLDVEGVEGNEWASMLELAPGESAMLYAQKDGYCGGIGIGGPQTCAPADFMLMSLNSDLAVWGETQPTLGLVASVKEEQQFSVEENAPSGTVIGKLEADTYGFFAIGAYNEESYSPFEFQLAAAIPGNPVSLAKDGTLTVNNSAALDYENLKSFVVKVQTRQGNDITPTVDVVVEISNLNDIAPVQEGNLPSINVMQGDSVEVSLGGLFTDAEGDSVSLSVSGLPAGLMFSAESQVVSGTADEVGQFTATVTASDGVNEVTSTMSIVVEAQPEDDSGSLGFGLPLLAWLMLRRRK
ncbi:S8 family serine peptidase [Ferrimonas balearica]|uniref:S8 family serine peptidase n=1 Tax=Ferrimonas balearica TaxID=44012 RepID=UPI001C9914E6|nr:S8 family serine peptidase [Ferrimonas balearica]MBY5923390.1 S8 family serine peptidase [Ferrimonas balearica]MBY5995140.1 S8 family serine peptidase [Ferrimonas balearica]